jgi:hypothetical protein
MQVFDRRLNFLTCTVDAGGSDCDTPLSMSLSIFLYHSLYMRSI